MMKSWKLTLLAMTLVCSAMAQDNLVPVRLFYNAKGEITVYDLASHLREGFIDSARRIFVGKVVEVDMRGNPIMELSYDEQGKKQGAFSYSRSGLKITTQFKDDVPEKSLPDTLVASMSNKEKFAFNVYIKRSEHPSLRGMLGSHQSAISSDTTSYARVDKMPEFPGGLEKAMYFVSINVNYPLLAMRNNVTGRVYVEFVIGTDGSVENPKVVRGIGAGCDDAALLAIRRMPDWIPGMNQGKPVRVKYTIPVYFGGTTYIDNSRKAK